MIGGAMGHADLRAAAFEGGLYTIPMAARLLATKNNKVRSWVEGYPSSDATPILNPRLARLHAGPLLTFLDLVETAWVAHFVKLGYSPQTIRKVANKLRERTNFAHPFALESKFLADGKAIFEETVSDTGERRLVNLMNNNFTMGPIVKQSLFDQIFYVEDVAAMFRPSEQNRRVVLNPKVANGHPVILDKWVPTRVLYESFKAEDQDADEVADQYAVTADDVLEAVAFERGLQERVLH
jgi:uncharacterized protein (DUF433 family)